MKEIYSINEVFGPTIQGEGSLIGMPTHFVRFNGCDYRCSWCDSLPSVLPELIRLPENRHILTVEEIIANLLKRPKAGLVTLSGGNPALIRNMKPLIEALYEVGFKVALETQGSVYQDWMQHLSYLILSPKPPSAKIDFKESVFSDIVWEFDSAFRNTDLSIKVVVFDEADIEFAAGIHERYSWVPFFVQCGTHQTHPELQDMVDSYEALVTILLNDNRFYDARILPQLHVWAFGHGRGV